MRLRVLGLGVLPLLAPAAAVHAHGIVYVDDQAGFEASARGVRVQAYLEQVPDAVTAVPETVIRNTTSNGAFLPSHVPPGVEFGTDSQTGLVVVGPSQTSSSMGPAGFAFVHPQDPNGSMFFRFIGAKVNAFSMQVVTEGSSSARVTFYTDNGFPLATADIVDDAHVAVDGDESVLGWVEVNAPAGLTGAHEGIGELVAYIRGDTVLSETVAEAPSSACGLGGTRFYSGRDINGDGVLEFTEREATEIACNQRGADPTTNDRAGFACGVTDLDARANFSVVYLLLCAGFFASTRRRAAPKSKASRITRPYSFD